MQGIEHIKWAPVSTIQHHARFNILNCIHPLFNRLCIVNPSVSLSLGATINGNTVIFVVDTGSALTILRKDTWERTRAVSDTMVQAAAKNQGSSLHHGVRKHWLVWRAVFCKFLDLRQWRLTFMVRYCSWVAVVVIDPLTTEAILGLDVLSQCTVDLLHKKIITGEVML